ncbi:MAG: hypothetical protein JXR76_23890 [Deltaproteobacteria bacterium]|nr:hypothetical protein [Deltaproteobacteria bacterium]
MILGKNYRWKYRHMLNLLWILIGMSLVACSHRQKPSADVGGLDEATIEMHRQKNKPFSVRQKQTISIGQSEFDGMSVQSEDASAAEETENNPSIGNGETPPEEDCGENCGPEFSPQTEDVMDVAEQEDAEMGDVEEEEGGETGATYEDVEVEEATE